MSAAAAAAKKKGGRKKAAEPEPLQPTLKGHTDLVSCVDFLNEVLFTGSWDRTARAWDLKTMELRTEYDEHTGGIQALALVNGQLWTASLDRSIRCWDAKSGACRDIIKMPSAVLCFDFNAALLFASCDDVVYAIDLKTKEVVSKFQGHSGLVSCCKVQFETRLVTGAWDNTVRIWDVPSAACQLTLRGHKDYITAIALNGTTLYTASLDLKVFAWDSRSGEQLGSFTCEDVPQCLASEKNALLVGLQNGKVLLLDSRTFEIKHTFIGHTSAVRCIKLIEGGRFFTGSKDATAKIWDLQDSTTKQPGAQQQEKEEKKAKGKGKDPAAASKKGGPRK